MPDLLTLTCPTCGAKLKVTEQIHILVCANCGNEHMVKRDHGAIYLAPMAADVRQIRVSSDKTAAELAIVRLTNEIKQAEIELDRVKGKKITEAGWAGVWFIAAIVTLIIGGNTNILNPFFTLFFTVLFVAIAINVKKKERREKDQAIQEHDIDIGKLQRYILGKQEQLKKQRQIANG